MSDNRYYVNDHPVRVGVVVFSCPMRLMLLAALLLGTAALHAQQFDHLALPVRDVNVSLSFYHSVLGLEQIADPFHDDAHAFVSLGGSLQLHLIRTTESIPKLPSDVHFAIRVRSLPAAIQILESHGIRYFDADDRPGRVGTRADGVRQIYLQDPDGYWIELNDRRAD